MATCIASNRFSFFRLPKPPLSVDSLMVLPLLFPVSPFLPSRRFCIDIQGHLIKPSRRSMVPCAQAVSSSEAASSRHEYPLLYLGHRAVERRVPPRNVSLRVPVGFTGTKQSPLLQHLDSTHSCLVGKPPITMCGHEPMALLFLIFSLKNFFINSN
jgi:hypothetical protein